MAKALQRPMADPTIQRIGRADTDTGAAYAYQSFGDLMSEVYRRTERWKDKEASIQGAETARAEVAEARRRGDMWSPQTEKRGIYWERYNETGLAAQAALLEGDIAGKVGAAAVTHEYDLDGFKETIEDTRGDYEDAHPILRDIAYLELQRRADSAAAGIQRKIADRAMDEGIATMTASLDTVERDMLNAARAGDIQSAGAKLAEYHQRVGIMENLYHLAPQAAQKLTTESERAVFMAAAKGDFERAMQQGRGIAFLADFQKRDSRLFDPDERDKLEGWMYSEISKVNALIDREDDRRRKLLKADQEMLAARLLPDAMNGKLNEAQLSVMRDEQLLAPADYESLYKINRAGPDIRDDPDTVNALTLMMLDGEAAPVIIEAATQAVANEQMTTGTLQNMILAAQDDKYRNVLGTPAGRMAADELSALANPGGPMAQYQIGMREKEIDARRILVDRMLAGDDPRQIVDDLRPMFKQQNLTSVMPNWIIAAGPGKADEVKTLESLERQMDGGLLTPEEYEQRVNELEKWTGD